MCFYEQFRFACGDFRWGNFREHCNKEYRRGETCGMKLVHSVDTKDSMCTLCEKIATKTRRWYNYEDKLKQWAVEGRLGELSATVEKYRADQAEVQRKINELNAERAERSNAIGRHKQQGGRVPTYQTNGYQAGYAATYANGYPQGYTYSYQ